MAQRLIVIGGDAAGMSAASAARRQLPQDQLEIVAFERGHYTSYSACGIPYFISGEVQPWQSLAHRTHADLEATGMTLRLDTFATDADPLGVDTFATHHLSLEEAPGAYETFQNKEDGMVKVVLHP